MQRQQLLQRRAPHRSPQTVQKSKRQAVETTAKSNSVKASKDLDFVGSKLRRKLQKPVARSVDRKRSEHDRNGRQTIEQPRHRTADAKRVLRHGRFLKPNRKVSRADFVQFPLQGLVPEAKAHPGDLPHPCQGFKSERFIPRRVRSAFAHCSPPMPRRTCRRRPDPRSSEDRAQWAVPSAESAPGDCF